MLVVDLLHEFELGVWKTLFTHLIRLLYAAGGGSDKKIIELDRRYTFSAGGIESLSKLILIHRYRQISTFGHGTIRKFAANSSEMKKLAARDFEDLLQVIRPYFPYIYVAQLFTQCAIPVFESLLEGEHNRRLIKLLY
jgi:hypothetical protein